MRVQNNQPDNELTWCLENPVGRLKRWLGEPAMYFDPCDYGDPYTKKTCLWGNFNHPVKYRVEPIKVCSQGSWIQTLGGKSERTKELRSTTPEGFAQAFYEANRPDKVKEGGESHEVHLQN